MRELSLFHNRIRDPTPLVENPGIGAGDVVDVRCNRLSLAPDSGDMRAVEALRGRDVRLRYAPQGAGGCG
ncbi:hypothetical protein Marky_0247 [Marinithermus hydrothermalis DSM 14884]|uniref:Uncharacterized protein n=1 Tax=Marinithermus hydrothermalis (strain DSM 14884 / JCM 11576 / T1) TaxID=869210 RepID=F2NNJ3_MARHT|nr:hypothetical protein Marky_0247 [Marinithermus hydrothermalis DSM 14884]